jgi:hypothetical protein
MKREAHEEADYLQDWTYFGKAEFEDARVYYFYSVCPDGYKPIAQEDESIRLYGIETLNRHDLVMGLHVMIPAALMHAKGSHFYVNIFYEDIPAEG